jgi:hypothetical protein
VVGGSLSSRSLSVRPALECPTCGPQNSGTNMGHGVYVVVGVTAATITSCRVDSGFRLSGWAIAATVYAAIWLYFGFFECV